jgi:CBS domain-containing protein
MTLLIKDIMNRNVKTVSPKVTIKDAINNMIKCHIGCLVITEDNKIVGILTERDVLKQLLNFDINMRGISVKDIMIRRIITVEENKNIDEAAELMKKNGIKKLPVVKAGKLVGIITATDIISTLSILEKKEFAKYENTYKDLIDVKKHTMNIAKEIEENQVIVLVLPEGTYSENIIPLVKDISKLEINTVYVSLSKSYSTLLDIFKKNEIQIDRFFFIDVISGAVEKMNRAENCVYVSNPSALTELSIKIDEVLNTKKFKNLIFDSPCTLIVYNKEEEVIKFMYALIRKVKTAERTAIFTCLEDDMKTNLAKNLGMFIDKIIRL